MQAHEMHSRAQNYSDVHQIILFLISFGQPAPQKYFSFTRGLEGR